jgi:D-3-phosphoglycerate dehydrogenase
MPTHSRLHNQVECHAKLSEEELRVKIRRAHAIGVRSKTHLTEEMLDEAERLMCVGCFCIGTDQTDVRVAPQLISLSWTRS